MTDEQKQAERQRRRQRCSPHYQSALLRADGTSATCNPVDAHFIGRLSERCPYEGCGALRFPGETLKSLCCHGGKAVLPPLTPMPAFLYGLYLGRAALSSEQLASLSPAQSRLLEDPSISSHFREHIRSYNSALGLASLTFSQEEVSGRGPPVIRVHGQMHRRLPACPAPDVQLRPVADDSTIIAQWVNRGDCHPRPQEQYAQLYVYSSADAAQQRLHHSTCLSPSSSSPPFGALLDFRILLFSLLLLFFRLRVSQGLLLASLPSRLTSPLAMRVTASASRRG